jgi:hypothetical protein
MSQGVLRSLSKVSRNIREEPRFQRKYVLKGRYCEFMTNWRGGQTFREESLDQFFKKEPFRPYKGTDLIGLARQKPEIFGIGIVKNIKIEFEHTEIEELWVFPTRHKIQDPRIIMYSAYEIWQKR